jgi:hypothetical protein
MAMVILAPLCQDDLDEWRRAFVRLRAVVKTASEVERKASTPIRSVGM